MTRPSPYALDCCAMLRASLRVLLALLLLFAQYGAEMHAMSHLRYDLEVAQLGAKNAPPLGHGIEQCVAFHGVAAMLQSAAPVTAAHCLAPLTTAPELLPALLPPRIVFNSRAPPALS